MLILSRKNGESLIINDNIEVKVLGVQGSYVKLGIEAPKNVLIDRKEIHELKKESLALFEKDSEEV